LLNEPTTDLTYSDIFLVPSRSDVISRLDVDLAADDGTGSAIPLVAANMTAVTGKRMAETMARRGGLAVLPQDVPLDVIQDVTAWIKTRHRILETPVSLAPSDTVIDALHLMGKRPHGAVVVVDGSGTVTGVVRAADFEGQDRLPRWPPSSATGRSCWTLKRSTPGPTLTLRMLCRPSAEPSTPWTPPAPITRRCSRAVPWWAS
jgi:IMP dehydrogenase/GMP reductase